MKTLITTARTAIAAAGIALAAAPAAAQVDEGFCAEIGFLAEQTAAARQFQTETLSTVLSRVDQTEAQLIREGNDPAEVHALGDALRDMMTTIFNQRLRSTPTAREEAVFETRLDYERACYLMSQ